MMVAFIIPLIAALIVVIMAISPKWGGDCNVMLLFVNARNAYRHRIAS